MPNTGFGITRPVIHMFGTHELMALQRTLRRCSTRFLVVTLLPTGEEDQCIQAMSYPN